MIWRLQKHQEKKKTKQKAKVLGMGLYWEVGVGFHFFEKGNTTIEDRQRHLRIGKILPTCVHKRLTFYRIALHKCCHLSLVTPVSLSISVSPPYLHRFKLPQHSRATRGRHLRRYGGLHLLVVRAFASLEGLQQVTCKPNEQKQGATRLVKR